MSAEIKITMQPPRHPDDRRIYAAERQRERSELLLVWSIILVLAVQVGWDVYSVYIAWRPQEQWDLHVTDAAVLRIERRSGKVEYWSHKTVPARWVELKSPPPP